MEFLFGSDLLVPGDAAFLADLHGSAGIDAVDGHADTSLLAWLAQSSRGDGRIRTDKAVDLVAALRTGLVERTKVQTGGEPQGTIASSRTSRPWGRCVRWRWSPRSKGIERSAAACGSTPTSAATRRRPVPSACWRWRRGMRPIDIRCGQLDILHGQASRYPSLETARYGLDVLGLRVSHERTAKPRDEEISIHESAHPPPPHAALADLLRVQGPVGRGGPLWHRRARWQHGVLLRGGAALHP